MELLQVSCKTVVLALYLDRMLSGDMEKKGWLIGS